VNDYKNKINSATGSFKLNIQKVYAQDFFKSGTEVWNYSFNPSTLNRFTLSNDNKTAVCGSGCNTDKRIWANEPLPTTGSVYWEVKRSQVSGCYDSIGVTTVQSISSGRNGESDNGWAIRLYGSHSDFSFTGAHHNGQKNKFFEAWTSDNTIGLLYNADAKTLSCFHNKKYVGTPFRDVEG